MRHDDIRNKYTRHGGAWNNGNELFKVGEQMQYEWEKDFIAMKWAIDYLTNGGLSDQEVALDLILKQGSQYSFTSFIKHQPKTSENCPLKEDCKNCFLTTPPNQDGDTIKNK